MNAERMQYTMFLSIPGLYYMNVNGDILGSCPVGTTILPFLPLIES